MSLSQALNQFAQNLGRYHPVLSGSGLCNPSHYECVSKGRLLAKFLGADLSYRIHARLGNQTAAFGA